MVNINCLKNSDHYKSISEILGDHHMTVFKDGKEIAIWYVSEEDKKVLEEMEKENASANA